MILNRAHQYPEDIAHIGNILVRIRESRGLSYTDLAMPRGISINTMARIEQEGTGNSQRQKSIEWYIEALQLKARHIPLTNNQVEFLKKLMKYSSDDHVIEAQRNYGGVSFQSTTPGPMPAELQALFTLLQQADCPAFIMDPLWFIHATNGSMFYLFEIDPNSKFLNHSEAWHVLGMKFMESSLIRDQHPDSEVQFTALIDQFFRYDATSHLFFTPQMRALLYRLHQFSKHYENSFSSVWGAVTNFSLKYDPKHLHRVIMYHGQNLLIQAPRYERINVELVPGCRVVFTLVFWDPSSAEATNAFRTISNLPESHQIYYAADYDKNLDFHVNAWPELRKFSF